MGSRASMLSRVASNLAAVSGLVEWPHGFDPESMSTAVANPGTRAAFALDLGASGALGDRQNKIVHLGESVTVGLLVHVKQSNHRASLEAALEVEDDVIGALLGAVPGWGVSWTGTTRTRVGGDGAAAPFLVVRVEFALISSVSF